jgi:trk system potassium uptake protein TrkA
MRVIVVGCGRVGSELAVRLQKEGYEVSIIDKNANAFRRLPDGWGGHTVVGLGFDRDVLLQAGIEDAHALAAVTSGDNSNILSARIARETFEIPHVVARIKSPRRAVIYQRLGIPTVATVSWTVDQVVRRLLPEEAVTAWTDPTGEINIVEHLLPESLCGRGYTEMADGERFRPVIVTRGGQSRLVGSTTVGQEGDVVHFAVRTDAAADLDRMLTEAQGVGARAAGGGDRRSEHREHREKREQRAAAGAAGPDSSSRGGGGGSGGRGGGSGGGPSS